MENVIGNFKSKVNECMSSIFTKEDVVKMLNEMESQMMDTPSSVNVEGLDKLLEKFKNKLERIKSDVEDIQVDDDDNEFRVDGREIVVDDIDVRGKDEVLGEIDDLICEIENEIEKVS